MKDLSSAMIKDLNSRTDSGIFFEAIIVTRDMITDPQVKDYFANFPSSFSFEGNIYLPAPLHFTGMNITASMEIPTNTVNIMNPGGIINQYIYDNDVRIRRNDIVLQILHKSNIGKITRYDEDLLQILVLRGVPGQGTASMFCSLGFKLGDKVPNQTMETSEYPAIRADVVRAST